MPTDAAIKNKQLGLEEKKLRQQARIEAHKIKQSERESERAERGQITAAALRTFGSAVGGMMKNDPAWYMHYAEGSKVAVNLPQFYTNGSNVDGNGILYPTGKIMGLPQACILVYHNVFGGIRGRNGLAQPNSLLDINQSADRMLAILRSYNSRLNSYPAYDMMQFFYAELELYRIIVRTCTALKIYAHEDAFNPQVRKTLLMGLGFDYDDLSLNIANYRAYLTEIITDLNTHLALPGDFPLIDRKLYLDSAIIKDGEGHNAQYFAFWPIEFHKYNEARSSLVPDWNFRTQTFTAFVNLVGNLYSTLKNVSYYVNLKADLIDASKSGLKLFSLDPNYALSPLQIITDDQCRTQIMNIRFLPNWAYRNTSDSGDLTVAVESYHPTDLITHIRSMSPSVQEYTMNEMISTQIYLNQDTDGFLVPCRTLAGQLAEDFQYDLGGTIATSAGTANYALNFTKLLNFHRNEISDGDIFEATRGMYNATIPAYSAGYVQRVVLTDYSTEIFTFGMIYQGSTGTVQQAGLFRTYASDSLFCFNYKPIRYDLNVQYGSFNGMYPVCEFDKVVPLQEGNLSILHSLATKSLFWIAPTITDYSYHSSGRTKRTK